MGLIDVRLPEGQQEGSASTLARWLVTPGATVAAHAPLAEIETDKVVVELPAPAGGILAQVLKSEGDAIEPGELIARIDPTPAGATAPGAGSARTADTVTPSESGAASVATPSGDPPPRDPRAVGTAPDPHAAGAAPGPRDERLSPAVRRMLAEYGLDPAQIPGTGRDGRITSDDVLAYRARVGPGPQPASSTAATPAPPATTDTATAGRIPGRRVPHDGMRKRIARHMVESLLHTAPHVTSVFEADLSAALAHRDAHKRDYAERGARLTLTAYFVEAACKALLAVPEVNARWHDDALELFDDVNIGVGTALEDRGLIVPVIRRVQTLDLFAIACRLDELTRAARDGKLAPADVQGGTFTISNHGVGGSLVATPIVINQPQVAILGVGKIEKRAVVVEEAGQERIVARPMAYVTLSIDHRALDAYQTNRFLSVLVEALETR